MLFSVLLFASSNSKEYTEFWSFLRKYQALVKRRQSNLVDASSVSQYSTKFNLPLKYEKRWRLNFVYKPNRFHLTTYDASGIILIIFLKLILFSFYFIHSIMANRQQNQIERKRRPIQWIRIHHSLVFGFLSKRKGKQN